MKNSCQTPKKGFILALVAGMLLGFSASALAIEELDCSRCHGTELPTIHHLARINSGLTCDACHDILQGPGGVTVFVVDISNAKCNQCHDGADHASLHDMPGFTENPQGEEACAQCHQPMVTEHLQRNLHCETCHSNPDPKIQAAIAKGEGPNGQSVYCIDCHDDAKAAFGIHNANHDGVCRVCHTLPMKSDGTILGIHDRAGADCINCHRFGTGEVDKNTIFSVQVNADPGEPADFNYDARPYLFGPCAVCHKGQKTNMGGDGRKGCLPCHFKTPEESWPTGGNSFFGSETWGHNIQKRNNEGKTISRK